jgi:hypothetical protein
LISFSSNFNNDQGLPSLIISSLPTLYQKVFHILWLYNCFLISILVRCICIVQEDNHNKGQDLINDYSSEINWFIWNLKKEQKNPHHHRPTLLWQSFKGDILKYLDGWLPLKLVSAPIVFSAPPVYACWDLS